MLVALLQSSSVGNESDLCSISSGRRCFAPCTSASLSPCAPFPPPQLHTWCSRTFIGRLQKELFCTGVLTCQRCLSLTNTSRCPVLLSHTRRFHNRFAQRLQQDKRMVSLRLSRTPAAIVSCRETRNPKRLPKLPGGCGNIPSSLWPSLTSSHQGKDAIVKGWCNTSCSKALKHD